MNDERRDVADRRRCPTPAVSRYAVWGGRRSTVRRGADTQAVYVDRIPPGILALILTVFSLHILDAFFTLFHVSRGGSELNPLMDYFLRIGPSVFLATKLGLAAVGLVFLGVHFRWPYVRHGLTALVLLYAGVLCYHLVLLWKVGAILWNLPGGSG